jgi:hypothetical protein
VEEPEAAVHQQAVHQLHVAPVVAVADRLEHRDGRDLVEPAPSSVRVHVAIVAVVDLDGQAAAELARVGDLDRREVHRDHRAPVVLRREPGERAEAAAQVEHAVRGAQPELAAHQVELGPLGRLEGLGRAGPIVAEVRARVGHARVEQQRVELVRQVVVVADRPAVATPGVQPSAHPRLRGRRLRRSSDKAEVAQRRREASQRLSHHPHARSCGEPACPPEREDVGEDLPEIPVHLELAGHVRLRGAELAGMPEQATQRVR